MSRIGKKPIMIPPGVTVTITGDEVSVKGPKGELARKMHPDLRLEVKGREIAVSPVRESKNSRALWGLWRQLIANMVLGTAQGFAKKLELEGIGYRANLEGANLVMQLGFSHPVRFSAPPGITFSVEKNVITVAGEDKELVGQTAARIRGIRPPEPYKGKGIRYQGEIVRRKAGKKAVAGG